MIHAIATWIASVFVLYGESSEEDADIYAYGLEAVIAALFNIVISLFISFLFRGVVEGIIFVLVFALLRRFTGGYHADTHYKCVLTFCALLTFAMLITSFVPEFRGSIIITFIIAIFSWIGIFVLAPIDDKGKSYSDEFRATLKKKSIAVSTLFLVICIIFGLVFSIYVALILALAMFSVFGGMVYELMRRSILGVSK